MAKTKTSNGTRVAPKKQFSQNFLTNANVAQRIVDQVQIQDYDTVIEIGPGEGALTTLLLETSATKIHAVDLDPRVVEHLEPIRSAHEDRLVIHAQDFLKSAPEQFFTGIDRPHRRVVGNIPYAITSDILFWLFDAATEVNRAVIMMQKEVAQRLVAKPRTKEYGILTVAAWYASQPKLCFNVSPGSFFPQPKVTSTVVAFDMREEPPTDIPRKEFRSFVRAAFSQRRKVLTNALAVWSQTNLQRPLREIELANGMNLAKTRAEELTPEQFVELYKDLKRAGG